MAEGEEPKMGSVTFVADLLIAECGGLDAMAAPRDEIRAILADVWRRGGTECSACVAGKVLAKTTLASRLTAILEDIVLCADDDDE